MRLDRLIVALNLCALSGVGFADGSIYCPGNHGYINVGMTSAQVLAACGQPTAKQISDNPIMQKVPVKQLIYNAQGANTVFYGQWALPIGTGGAINNGPNFRSKQSTGTTLQVDVINNKVSSVKVNNSASNAFSICNNQNVQIGDPVSKVYNACGSPTLSNSTYINQPIPSATKPEIWLYQIPYQPTISLTFIDGKLQSIN